MQSGEPGHWKADPLQGGDGGCCRVTPAAGSLAGTASALKEAREGQSAVRGIVNALAGFTGRTTLD